jgi:hypothetical protein
MKTRYGRYVSNFSQILQLGITIFISYCRLSEHVHGSVCYGLVLSWGSGNKPIVHSCIAATRPRVNEVGHTIVV